MNRVSLVGRITTKPELRYTATQVPYTRFNIAVNRTFSNNQGQREADFIGVVVWRKQAEVICNYLDKGSLISVDGRIQTGSYTDKDGSKKYTFDVVSDNVQFLESKAQAQARTSSGNQGYNYGNNSEIDPYTFQEPDYGNTLESSNDIYSSMGDSISLDDADID